ncbi:hypothetical protein BDN67DRAFT_946942 [Paxillus ammoniavirescens]|nr:hypothetical protein BDN67DRAFT_946942 [Paxillus ammoniavirescens]
MTDIMWRPDQARLSPRLLLQGDVYRPDILAEIESSIDSLSPRLRELSNKIHAHPELMFEEHYAHDEYTKFMEGQGFVVQKHYLLETAWVATYTHGQGGHTLGVNSEMDALPGIGHACGHNLIGVSGVAVACAAKAAMEKLFGKVLLWDKGAYEGMDFCLMCHPGPGPPLFASLGSCLAMVHLQVDYSGHTAHAGLSPWEGQNALDAAVLAYTNIGLMRQQIKPTHRVHGVFHGKDWTPNIIPDNSTMQWFVRAPTTKEALETVTRVKACFEAAATATGCTVKITPRSIGNELVQNVALGAFVHLSPGGLIKMGFSGEEFVDVVRKRYGDTAWGRRGIAYGSTDFGNISYLMPGLHPYFSIPTLPGGANHTRAFTDAAASDAAHEACYNISKALAHVGMRALTDETFLTKVKLEFKEWKQAQGN